MRWYAFLAAQCLVAYAAVVYMAVTSVPAGQAPPQQATEGMAETLRWTLPDGDVIYFRAEDRRWYPLDLTAPVAFGVPDEVTDPYVRRAGIPAMAGEVLEGGE